MLNKKKVNMPYSCMPSGGQEIRKGFRYRLSNRRRKCRQGEKSTENADNNEVIQPLFSSIRYSHFSQGHARKTSQYDEQDNRIFQPISCSRDAATFHPFYPKVFFPFRVPTSFLIRHLFSHSLTQRILSLHKIHIHCNRITDRI